MSGKIWLRVVRDRNQYFIETVSTEQLRRDGMLRAFDDRKAFEQAVLNWLQRV